MAEITAKAVQALRSKTGVVALAHRVAIKRGQLPHEILLRACQTGRLCVKRGRKPGYIDLTLEQVIRCAVAAAPFYASKLKAVAVQPKGHLSHEEALRQLEGED